MADMASSQNITNAFMAAAVSPYLLFVFCLFVMFVYECNCRTDES